MRLANRYRPATNSPLAGSPTRQVQKSFVVVSFVFIVWAIHSQNHIATRSYLQAVKEQGNINHAVILGSTETLESKVNKDIWIQMRFPRSDRLATNIELPLFLMAYAHCYGYSFCIQHDRLGLAKYFPGFVNQICPPDLGSRNLTWYGSPKEIFIRPPKEPGIYASVDYNELGRWMRKNEDCAFDDGMRKKWRQMILDASNSTLNPMIVNKTLAEEELFEKTDDPRVVTVAINVRRGDNVEWGRKVWLDQFYVMLLRHLRFVLEKAGKIPEVHLFSEDYGMVDPKLNITRNWTMYEDLVQHFHLAPDMRTEKNEHAMDLDLNFRDWRHFLKADVLVADSHFATTPSLGRPKAPDPRMGLPLTMKRMPVNNFESIPSNDTIYTFGWTFFDYGVVPNKYLIRNLPEVFAKHDTLPMETFTRDLVAEWNATYNQKDS